MNLCLYWKVYIGFFNYLIEHGININKENIYNGKILLFNACESDNENIVQYLVKYGVWSSYK